MPQPPDKVRLRFEKTLAADHSSHKPGISSYDIKDTVQFSSGSWRFKHCRRPLRLLTTGPDVWNNVNVIQKTAVIKHKAIMELWS